jgi:hypothetical protein
MGKIKADRRSWVAAALVIVATLLSASCGGGASTQAKTASSNSAGLTFNTANLDFGSIAIGSNKKAAITVTNSSASTGGSVTVSKITVSGAGFSLVTPTSGFSLDPGQSSTITVAFAPKTAGAVAGNLAILVGGIAAADNVGLTGGTLAGNQLGIAPASMGFGTVAVGASKSLTGSLSAGATDVTVNSASWNGQGYSLSGITFPQTVAAGKSISYTVTFTPEAAGSASGGVIFLSSASNSALTETFSGSGGTVAQAKQHIVDLSWSLSASQVVGYNVYRGLQSGGPYSRLNSSAQPGPTFTDASVKSGSTYYYVATSVDASSVESPYSDEVVAAIPNP